MHQDQHQHQQRSRNSDSTNCKSKKILVAELHLVTAQQERQDDHKPTSLFISGYETQEKTEVFTFVGNKGKIPSAILSLQTLGIFDNLADINLFFFCCSNSVK